MAHFDVTRTTRSIMRAADPAEPSARRTNTGRNTGRTPGRNPSGNPSRNGGRSTPRKSTARERRVRGRQTNGYLSLGHTLGSERDRQRLRARNADERERVERMLASVPSPADPPSTVATAEIRSLSQALASAPHSSWSAASACPVCESSKVVRDEVFRAGSIRLSECLHCDFRWTDSAGSRSVSSVAADRVGRAPALSS